MVFAWYAMYEGLRFYERGMKLPETCAARGTKYTSSTCSNAFTRRVLKQRLSLFLRVLCPDNALQLGLSPS